LPVPARAADIEHLQRLPDPPGGVMPPARAVRALPADAFEPVDDVHRLASDAGGRGWWRLQAAPASGSEPLLVVYHPYSARVTVMAPPDYRPVTQSLFDRTLDPRFSRRALVFPLPAAGPVYIGVEGARYPLQVAVRDANAQLAEDVVHVRLISMVIGVLIGISLVVLLFWLLLRERVYLLYAATMVLQLMYLLCAYGEAYALPGLRVLAMFGVEGIWTVATLATAAASFFLIRLTDLEQHARLPSRLLRWVGGYASLALVVLLWLPWPADKGWFPAAGNATLLVANALALLALGVASWRRHRRAAYALLAWVPLVALSTARAVQLGTGAALTPGVEYGLPLMLAFTSIVLVLILADRMLTMRHERDRAQLHAERDALTGVFNRSGIEQRLDWAITRARDHGGVLSAIFLDLDHFKDINDAHGHAVGDACMRELVRAAGGELAYGDHIGRLGGEEFLLALPGSDLPQARRTGERIRRSVEVQCAHVDGIPVALTVSVGVAAYRMGDSVASLVARSAQAMYAAKHAGRNRVEAMPAA
ncbi:MAG: GGDEF domain-containing protein, partial [Luteimonas sp.]|nr:GGDEF domain-containing protein [Luteimonas sp.]